MLNPRLIFKPWTLTNLYTAAILAALSLAVSIYAAYGSHTLLALVALLPPLTAAVLLPYQIGLRTASHTSPKKNHQNSNELELLSALHAAVLNVQNKQTIKIEIETGGNPKFNAIIECFNSTINKQLDSENRFQELSIQIQEKTDQLNAQQKSDSDRNQNIHKMFAGASHDLRQPLQAMIIFIAALQENATPAQAPLLQKLEQVVDNLNHLFTDLLDISKLESRMKRIPKKNVEIAPLLEKIYNEFEVLAHEKNIGIRLYNRDLSAFSNPNMLERIIRNMLSNAIRYTRTGGVLIGCRKRDEEVWIEVWDTGRGIPQDKMDDIFNEYVQIEEKPSNSNKGVGLGLFIVKRLAQLLDHSILVSSALHRGTMFRIVVPMNPMYPHSEFPAFAPPPNIAIQNKGQSLNIALIDDDHVVRSSITTLLRSWGMQVQSFESMQSISNLKMDAKLDLIVSDFQLGMNDTGIEAIALIRKQQKNNTPAIIITGTSNESLLENIKSSAIPLLKKPVKPAKLRALISMLCTE